MSVKPDTKIVIVGDAWDREERPYRDRCEYYFGEFESAIKYLKVQEFEYDGTEPCGTIVRYKQSQKKKVAHVHAPDASTVQAYYHSAPSNPSLAADDLCKAPVALESLDSLREAARVAIAALTEQAARLGLAADDANRIKSAMWAASTAKNTLIACKRESMADCKTAVENFFLLAEEMFAKHECDRQKDADRVVVALTSMKAALDQLNA